MTSFAPRGRFLRRALMALVAVLVVAGLVWAWLPSPVEVDVVVVTRGDVADTVFEDGRTRVSERYVVSAPVAGELERIALEPGDPVEAGQVVASIVPPAGPLLDAPTREAAEARLEAAEAAVLQAEAGEGAAEAAAAQAARDVERFVALVEAGAVAKRDLEQARTEARVQAEQLQAARFAAEVARHEVDTARAVLDGVGEPSEGALRVVAPVAGRVLQVLQESTAVVAPGTPLVEIGDPSSLEIVVDVLSEDAVRIERLAPVTIERWGGPDRLTGHVHHVEPAAFTKLSALGVEEQRVNVIVHVDTPPEDWADLGDGFRVEARIGLERREDVLVAPESAFFRSEDGYAAWRVTDGRARLTPVELGLRSGIVAEVTSGLEEGDLVIAHPSELVEEGARVRVRP